MSFSRKDRLISKRDFQFVLAHPKKFTYQNLIVLYRENTYGYARLGMRLPKRVIKRAVDRNKIKRMIRESFRQYKETLKSLDIIIVMQSEWNALDNKTMWHDIGALWQRLAK